MKFQVTFSAPVTYLPGHSKQQQITTLLVSAPDAEHAKMHALRVTQGAAVILDAVEVAHAAA